MHKSWLVMGTVMSLLAVGGSRARAASAGHNILLGSSVPVVDAAIWEESGSAGSGVKVASGAAAVGKAPHNAVRYRAKTFDFPTGSVKELTFSKDTGGVLYQIGDETELYVLRGAAQVQIDGKTVNLSAGDTVFMPSGLIRNAGSAQDAVIVAYSVVGAAFEPKAQVLRGSEVAQGEWVHEWAQDNKWVVTKKGSADAAKAPKQSIFASRKSYPLDGNSIRIMSMNNAAGAHAEPVSTLGTPGRPLDALLYVSAGHLRARVADEVADVHPGDVIRQPANTFTQWTVYDDTQFIATNTLPCAKHQPKAQ